MRKIFLLVMMALFGIQLKAAEQFDELNLLGVWELVSYSGTYDAFTENQAIYEGSIALSECKYLYLEDLIYACNDEEDILTSISSLPEIINSGTYYEWQLFAGAFSKTKLETSSWDDLILLTDFLISNSNKLHIEITPVAIRFTIESLSDTEMKLKSYDGKFTATYKRVSGPSMVKSISDASESGNAIYNLSGMRIKTPTKGVNIIRYGKKISKVIL